MTGPSAFDVNAHLLARVAAWRAAWPQPALTAEPALVSGHIETPVDVFDDVLDRLVAHARAHDARRLTVRTEHVDAIGGEIGPQPPLAPGRYLRVLVQDDGRARPRAEAEDAAVERTVREAVTAHGGALWIDTAEDGGARAFVYLPLVRPEGSPPRPIVLLVEDEPAVRTVVRRILQGQGFLVREARDGNAALRFWHAERTHVRGVVTDVVMPGLGGRDLARELRRLDPALPVLFMSAYTDVPDLLEGVDEPRRMLPKPFTTEALLSELRALLVTA